MREAEHVSRHVCVQYRQLYGAHASAKHGRVFGAVLPTQVMKGVRQSFDESHHRYLCPSNQPDGPVGDSTRFCNVSGNVITTALAMWSRGELHGRPQLVKRWRWNGTVKRIASMDPHHSKRNRCSAITWGTSFWPGPLAISLTAFSISERDMAERHDVLQRRVERHQRPILARQDEAYHRS